MKCIVTGGAGFIGSHLVEELIKCNYKVIVLDNLISGNLTNLKKVSKNITFIKCDLSKNKNSWSKYFKNADYVFHLAAMADIVPSIDNPELYYNANVLSSLNVMQACKKYKIKKIIYAASSSCYGIPGKYPTSESILLFGCFPLDRLSMT